MSAAGALSGLRVVEFSSAMAGPWIGRFMAWAGAEVIRVESRKRPDVVRGYVPPWDPALGTQPEMSPWFTDWNAGKRFVSLDLTHPRAVELAKGLVAVSDLVVENQAAGVMDKLGLGYKDLSAVREDIIMISSSGFGDSGPASRHVTWGPNIEAVSGLATATGFAGSDCTVTQYAYPDSVSAMHGLFAVMCALDHRRRSGQGQYINMSQYETLVSAIGHLVLEQIEGDGPALPCGNRARDRAPQGAYPCRGEDRWLVLSVDGEKDWKALGAVLERPDLGENVTLVPPRDRLGRQAPTEHDGNRSIADGVRPRANARDRFGAEGRELLVADGTALPDAHRRRAAASIAGIQQTTQGFGVVGLDFQRSVYFIQ